MVIDSALNHSTVAEIQRDVNRQKGRNRIYRFICARANKDTIAEWWAELPRILQIFQVGSVGYARLSLIVRFQTELSIKTHVKVEETYVKVEEIHVQVEDTHVKVEETHVQVEEIHVQVEETHVQVKEIHKAVLEIRDGQNLSVSCAHSCQLEKNAYSCPASNQVSASGSQGILYLMFDSSILPGELPPPAPRNLFGRSELIEEVVGLAENMEPIALIGAGGIGKTSIALTVLHCDRIKKQFGDSRWFIRCDRFNASRTNFLRRLSEAIGAGIDNPEGLGPLRSFLTSKEMFIVLDNAESILDPQGTDADEIQDIVEELCKFRNICLCITSRINAIPSDCNILDVPTMSMEAARSTFYCIYDNKERPVLIDDILTQLEFHPLSVTLLAKVARRNGWNNDRLVNEWGQRQTGALQKGDWKNFAATIELSLASPTFKALGPDARGILEVVAFFPQGVSENDFHRLFPTVLDGNHILDELCVLSLTYRSGEFVTMLAPIRDHLGLKDPSSSPLLRKTKEYYFTRMSVEIEPHIQGSFDESRWITLEDANVEHLIDVFTNIDPKSDDVWKACADFMKHLHWHKQRKTVLGPKVGALPDSHQFKPLCLFELSRVLQSIGSDAGRKGLLSHALKLERQRGDPFRVALTLVYLAEANQLLGLYEEGLPQAREALAIAESRRNPVEIAGCSNMLAWLLYGNLQAEDAENAATRALNLLPEKGQEFLVCQSHRILGEISLSRERRDEAIHHFENALRVATPVNLDVHIVWIHHSLALLFSGERKFEDAQAHLEKAERHAASSVLHTSHTVLLRAWILYRQDKFEEAKPRASHALEVFKELGATRGQGMSEGLLQIIDQAMKGLPTTGESDLVFQWRTMLRPPPVDSPSLK